jgi:hypothetical protein
MVRDKRRIKYICHLLVLSYSLKVTPEWFYILVVEKFRELVLVWLNSLGKLY